LAVTVDEARRIAEEVFLPAAPVVDAADRIPAGHLDLLAAQGFYGPPPMERTDVYRIVETLASGCLATTFVWMQHLGALRGCEGTRWAEPMARGEVRAGVALGALRPGPASLRAQKVPGGYLLDGESPWVTGWDMIHVLYTAARDERDDVLWCLLDAVPGPTLTVTPLDLVAVRASRTVLVQFVGHFVPDERVVDRMPYADWPARDTNLLRGNGSLALGLAGRCAALLDSGPLRAAVDGCRYALDTGTPAELPDARAAASALAARAAAALAVGSGAGAVLRGSHAERLGREALFLLVFGSRPSIKESLARRLAE
jgi:alkylation response protein AidB-like acyl-CoA dehydrogenase